MDSIRVSSGTKKIEVNDEGEYITLPLGDDGFTRDFYRLLDDFQRQAQAVKVTEEDITGSMDQVVALNKELSEKVDSLFGAGTCKKVFGVLTPGVDLFLDFFTQLLPFFEASVKKRSEKLNKYNAGRTGSV